MKYTYQHKLVKATIVFGLILSLLVGISGNILAEEQLGQSSNRKKDDFSGLPLLGGVLGTIGGTYLISYLFREPEAYKHITFLGESPISKYGLIVLSGATLGSATGVISTEKLLGVEGSERGAITGGLTGSFILVALCYIIAHSPIALIEYSSLFHIGVSFIPAFFAIDGYNIRNRSKNHDINT